MFSIRNNSISIPFGIFDQRSWKIIVQPNWAETIAFVMIDAIAIGNAALHIQIIHNFRHIGFGMSETLYFVSGKIGITQICELPASVFHYTDAMFIISIWKTL